MLPAIVSAREWTADNPSTIPLWQIQVLKVSNRSTILVNAVKSDHKIGTIAIWMTSAVIVAPKMPPKTNLFVYVYQILHLI